jgi:hypothetical protein
MVGLKRRAVAFLIDSATARATVPFSALPMSDGRSEPMLTSNMLNVCTSFSSTSILHAFNDPAMLARTRSALVNMAASSLM